MSTHQTRKSFKTNARDKAKHSAKDSGNKSPKKGGAGGKGTWGVAQDDMRFNAKVDDHDPNFDPLDEADSFVPRGPSKASRKKFDLSVKDLNHFKKVIKDAIDEYVGSYEEEDFVQTVKELDLSLYHQDIPAIVIKKSFDIKEEARMKLSHLLSSLHKAGIISPSQMASGFRKLFNALEDLILDIPNAKNLLSEFVGMATASGYLSSTDAADMEKMVATLSDKQNLADAKTKIDTIVEEYFDSEEEQECADALKQLNVYFGFEVTKRLVSRALDRTHRERELASKLLGSGVIKQQEIEKGFTVLLGRVEDIYLDVPDVLNLLGNFIARAVVDEALSPAFLSRLDLEESDMGSFVSREALLILKRDKAPLMLARVWQQSGSMLEIQKLERSVEAAARLVERDEIALRASRRMLNSLQDQLEGAVRRAEGVSRSDSE